MKNIKPVVIFVFFLCFTARVMAAEDIDIDTSAAGAPAAATPTVSAGDTGVVSTAPVFTPTSVAASPLVRPTVSESPAAQPDEVLSLTPISGQGILKMKDVYKAGFTYYKKEDFANAIRYLKESLQIQDPYTPKYYYAEANAILGVIYQFHIIDKSVAYYYYKKALSIDATTATAKKHIKEVSDYKDSE